jgi:hypothetical protein
MREGAASLTAWPRQRGRQRRRGAEAKEDRICHVRVISCTPAELHMFIRAFKPFEIQRLYRARKSAVVEAEALAVAAGGDLSRREPFWTTSAQEGELVQNMVVF